MGNHKGFNEIQKQYNLLPSFIKDNKKLVFGTFCVPENELNTFLINGTVVRDYLSEKEKYILHKNAWLYVGASTYEGFGFSLLESMNHDRPVIAIRCTLLRL